MSEDIKQIVEKIDCLDGKVDKIGKCVEKIDRTIHGDSEIGFNGMLKEQKRIKAKQKEIENLMWFPKLVDDFWQNIKRPIYLLILSGILAIISLIISISIMSN